MTATVETVVEQLDLAPIIMSERVIPAVARAVTLTDTDVGKLSVFAHLIFLKVSYLSTFSSMIFIYLLWVSQLRFRKDWRPAFSLGAWPSRTTSVAGKNLYLLPANPLCV